jgi:hypothetical protein
MRALILLISVGVCVPALADEDLVAKREMCQAEAGQRIKPRGAVSPEVARKLIGRRMEFVRECMDQPAVATKGQVTATGAVKSATRSR